MNRPAFLASLLVMSLSSLSAAEPYRKLLTSADRGVHVAEWQVTERDMEIKRGHPLQISKRTLRGGKQEGVDLITVNNGKLTFSVIPTRGMGILRVESGDVRLGWDSPVKEVVHPSLVNLQSRGGLGWLEGFNEWMVRCGLEFAGHPGKDKFINNVGDETEMDLTLHGKIGNIPASEVEILIDRDPPHRIRVRGRVDERMFYGPKLELWTEISTEPGSASFRIEDTVKNYSAFEQEFQIIYHANFGPPILDGGAKFAGAIRQVTPFNAHAATGVQSFGAYSAPAKGFVEQVYCLHPYAGGDGKTAIMLHNASRNQAVTMRFSVEQLPFITLWKNTNAREEGYVTGLEPGTGFPYNRRVERHFGRVPKLQPGASRSFAIDFAVAGNSGEVAAAAEQIVKIQAGRPTQIDEKPVPLP